jgi:hypothetical protein
MTAFIHVAHRPTDRLEPDTALGRAAQPAHRYVDSDCRGSEQGC